MKIKHVDLPYLTLSLQIELNYASYHHLVDYELYLSSLSELYWNLPPIA